MRKIVVSEGVTLDGVFDAQTMGQWAAPFYSDEKDEFVRKSVLAADALLLGRTTYDLQAWYWPSQKEDKYGIANHKNSIPSMLSLQSRYRLSGITRRSSRSMSWKKSLG
jgi:dihydrofolate reductase